MVLWIKQYLLIDEKSIILCILTWQKIISTPFGSFWSLHISNKLISPFDKVSLIFFPIENDHFQHKANWKHGTHIFLATPKLSCVDHIIFCRTEAFHFSMSACIGFMVTHRHITCVVALSQLYSKITCFCGL